MFNIVALIRTSVHLAFRAEKGKGEGMLTAQKMVIASYLYRGSIMGFLVSFVKNDET